MIKSAERPGVHTGRSRGRSEATSCPMVDGGIPSEVVASNIPVAEVTPVVEVIPVDRGSVEVTIDDGGRMGDVGVVIEPDVPMSPIGSPVIPAPTPVSECADAYSETKPDPARSEENTVGRVVVVSGPHAKRSAVDRPGIVSRHVHYFRIRRFHNNDLVFRGYLLFSVTGERTRNLAPSDASLGMAFMTSCC